MKTFVDTLFVVALVSERDQHHSKALDPADLYLRDQLITTDAVLLEIGNALSGRFRNEAISIISDFLNSKNVEVVGLDDNLFTRLLNYTGRTATNRGAWWIVCLS